VANVKPGNASAREKRVVGENYMKSVLVVFAGLLSLLYILNPGAGIFELIPDNIPFFGNLDEATAVMIFLSCLRYFNVDVANFFKRPPRIK